MDYIKDGFIKAAELLAGLDEETYSAILATLKASTLSILFSILLGMPAGFMLGNFDFRGKRQIRAIVDTLLALPTVVVGLTLYAFISRRGILGEMGLLFTISGIVIAQTLLVLPIVISLTATAIEGLDERMKSTIMTLGAKGRRIILTSLYEARYALFAAAVNAYGRAVSEVGASMMIGGNIKWHTRTITTAIALETGKGEFATGIALGIVLLAIALLVNGSLMFFKRRA